MAMQDSSGYTRLARVIADRAAHEGNKPQALDYGEIQANLALRANTFPVPIPQGDYLVLAGAVDRVIPGSRVLIAWVGNDAVVIDAL